MSPDSQDVTRLLQQWRDGDSTAFDTLLPLIYNELRSLAGRCLYSERPGHTLRATALVHEAYLRLVDSDIDWQDKGLAEVSQADESNGTAGRLAAGVLEAGRVCG